MPFFTGVYLKNARTPVISVAHRCFNIDVSNRGLQLVISVTVSEVEALEHRSVYLELDLQATIIDHVRAADSVKGSGRFIKAMAQGTR